MKLPPKWDVVWWAIRPKNSAQELLLCVLLCVMVRCGVVSHPAQELGPRTSSLCSLLSACDVWCCRECHPAQELGPRTSSLCSLLSACDVWWWDVVWWAIRPKNSAQELLLCVLLCVMVRCGVVSHLAQELGPRTSSLCSLLSACDVWYGESAHTHRVLTHSAHT